VRKRIAKYLTVINQQRRAQIRKDLEKKGPKALPLDMRGKKTRAIRRQLSKSNRRIGFRLTFRLEDRETVEGRHQLPLEEIRVEDLSDFEQRQPITIKVSIITISNTVYRFGSKII
jgi:hypothetical protein